MNIGPEQPVEREPLTPEERELAQRLSRLGPSAGPPSTVDARILAAAHDAIAAAHPRAAGRDARRWPVALGVAASMALAVGIAWRLRPLPEPPPVRAESAAASVETTVAPAAAAPIEVTAPAPGPATDADSAALQKEQRSAPAAAPQDAAKALPKRESAPPPPAEPEAVSDAARAADLAAPPPPPPPPPAPSAPQPLSAAAEAANADAATTGAAAASEESKRLSETIEVSGTVQRAKSVAAPRAASAQAPVAPQREPQSFEDIEIVGVDDNGDEPPAYANSPQVREAWLQRIRELIAEGHPQQARDSLDEFQRRYPDQPLPDDLQRFQKPDPAAP